MSLVHTRYGTQMTLAAALALHADTGKPTRHFVLTLARPPLSLYFVCPPVHAAV